MCDVPSGSIILKYNAEVYLLVYVLLPIIILYKSKIQIINKEYLGRNNTDVWKGIFIFFVVLGHVTQRMADPGFVLPLRIAGLLGVSGFLFLSGYGLSVSYLRKKDFFDRFLLRRLSRVWYPYIVINLIVLCVGAFWWQENWKFADWLFYGFGLKMIDGTMWFINATLILYVGFYFSFKYFSKREAVLLLCSYTIMYWGICFVMNLGDWWFNSIFTFPLGVIVAIKYKVIEEYNKKIIKMKYYLPLLGILVIILGGTIGGSHLLALSTAGILIRTVESMIVPVIFMMLALKIQLLSPIMAFIGRLSFEIYLVHMKILYVYFQNVEGHSILAYMLFVFTAAMILKWVINLISKYIFRGV